MRPAPCGYSSARIFETVLFFLCQKEKNGFNLPRKERGRKTYSLLLIFAVISRILSCSPDVESAIKRSILFSPCSTVE